VTWRRRPPCQSACVVLYVLLQRYYIRGLTSGVVRARPGIQLPLSSPWAARAAIRACWAARTM
jgi:hypothetical protein